MLTLSWPQLGLVVAIVLIVYGVGTLPGLAARLSRRAGEGARSSHVTDDAEDAAGIE
ncbi:MAG TPA: hypothetical protein VFN57_00830 [Thermomicrobiaceae bacterium]|nr:hypothetical protein [Thermomicrobiaceae bacterium]